MYWPGFRPALSLCERIAQPSSSRNSLTRRAHSLKSEFRQSSRFVFEVSLEDVLSVPCQKLLTGGETLGHS
jgi:hypothetical protein